MTNALATLTLFNLLQQGGWAMFPLGGLSLCLLILICFIWLQTTRGSFGLKPSRWSDNTIKRQIEAVLEEAVSLPETDKQAKAGEKLERVEGDTLRWIQYLNVIATIAPMVGLLGTVSGMISAFQTIAAGGMGKPELLAGDIGEALITTATGLCIGIPAMIFYFVLRNRLEQRLVELEVWLQETCSGSG